MALCSGSPGRYFKSCLREGKLNLMSFDSPSLACRCFVYRIVTIGPVVLMFLLRITFYLGSRKRFLDSLTDRRSTANSSSTASSPEIATRARTRAPHRAVGAYSEAAGERADVDFSDESKVENGTRIQPSYPANSRPPRRSIQNVGPGEESDVEQVRGEKTTLTTRSSRLLSATCISS